MNIKEAEKLTGISKRNIRFYEQKGMLHPARNQDNDYRDYSSQDIERLKLIRALRMVDMPLEEIQKVLDGKTSLEDAATAQERQLRERIPPKDSNNFCHRMVLHGRAVCTARKPDCQNCTLRPWCSFFQKSADA